MRNLLRYLRARRTLLLFALLSGGIVWTMGALNAVNRVFVRYTLLLMGFVLLAILLADGARFLPRQRALARLIKQPWLVPEALPTPMDALQGDYDALLRLLSDEAAHRDETARRDAEETLEYYTIWVHQIKTPIAAMRLVLSDRDDGDARVLKQELFKVEQYAELALQFVKLSGVASDLVIEEVDLTPIAHAAVKKYSLLFVYNHLTVSVEPLPERVPCDAKWLDFILCQLLSNAVKYTKTGGVRIYFQEGALVVEDTGIGIRREDLPRIFEKGYTGYNGRLDTRASGIGLYLAKKAADALSIRIRAESEVGKGTRMLLFLPAREEIRE